MQKDECMSAQLLSHVQLFSTLWTIAHQAARSMRFSRQEYWSRYPCPPPGDLPDPGIKPVSLTSPALASGFFTTSATWEACLLYSVSQFSCSVTSDSLRPHGLQSARLLCPWNSSGTNTGVCSCSILQGIFPTQGLNPGLPHCRWILYQLSHKGSLNNSLNSA